MESINPITTSAPKIGVDVPPRGGPTPMGEQPERQGLEPAVTVELSRSTRSDAAAEQGRYVRDTDSRSVVFQVTDPVSGDVIVQIPNEVVIKARAYTRQPEQPVGERVEKSV